MLSDSRNEPIDIEVEMANKYRITTKPNDWKPK